MKTRFDFVTNSSSSSFILGFRSKDEAIDRISEEMSLTLRAYSQLLHDVSKAECVDKQEVVNRLNERLDWVIKSEILYGEDGDRWIAENNFQKRRDEFMETEEYKQIFAHEKAWRERQYERILEVPFVVELEYGNDSDCENYEASMELEHMLSHQGYTLESISYH